MLIFKKDNTEEQQDKTNRHKNIQLVQGKKREINKSTMP